MPKLLLSSVITGILGVALLVVPGIVLATGGPTIPSDPPMPPLHRHYIVLPDSSDARDRARLVRQPGRPRDRARVLPLPLQRAHGRPRAPQRSGRRSQGAPRGAAPFPRPAEGHPDGRSRASRRFDGERWAESHRSPLGHRMMTSIFFATRPSILRTALQCPLGRGAPEATDVVRVFCTACRPCRRPCASAASTRARCSCRSADRGTESASTAPCGSRGRRAANGRPLCRSHVHQYGLDRRHGVGRRAVCVTLADRHDADRAGWVCLASPRDCPQRVEPACAHHASSRACRRCALRLRRAR